MFGKKTMLAGAVSGVVGGLVFGLMMAKMGTLPMIGRMIGSPTDAAGWAAHLMISATIGISFSVLLGWLVSGRTSSLVFGGLYGAAWWLLGPLTLMPLFLGMGLGVNWNLAAAQAMLPSLAGHAVFGVVMGWTYEPVLRRLATRRPAAARAKREADAAA
jgi:hypothetical protein